MYSASDINELLNDYLKTSEGKQVIKQSQTDAFNGKDNGTGLLSKEEMIIIGTRLKDMIYNAILSSMANPHFDESGIIVNTPIQDANGNCHLSISFTDEALYRDSLSNGEQGSGRTGKGVYDIIGLFTNGYSTDKQVFGYWENADTWTYNRTYLESNPFIAEAISEFNIKYASKGIEVAYPSEWGGNL